MWHYVLFWYVCVKLCDVYVTHCVIYVTHCDAVWWLCNVILSTSYRCYVAMIWCVMQCGVCIKHNEIYVPLIPLGAYVLISDSCMFVCCNLILCHLYLCIRVLIYIIIYNKCVMVCYECFTIGIGDDCFIKFCECSSRGRIQNTSLSS